MVAELRLVSSYERLIEHTYRTAIALLEQRLMLSEASAKLNAETIAFQQAEIHKLEAEVARLRRREEVK